MSNADIDKNAQLGASVDYPYRMRFIWVLLACLVGVIFLSLVNININDRDFLQREGENRTERYLELSALRGKILDRRGKALAVSAPVVTLWLNPSQFDIHHPKFEQLTHILNLDSAQLHKTIQQKKHKQFLYLSRKTQPELAQQVLNLDIPGVYVKNELKRYYPSGEVSTHLVGFENIDGYGQEGMELVFDEYLQAKIGKQLIQKDLNGKVVKKLNVIEPAQAGQDINLSIDLRMQYIAYRELKSATEAHQAKSGMAVILDVKTGEVLAMVNQPAYNPNNRKSLDIKGLRNRVLTDIMEPGSTIKPLTVAAALINGGYTSDSLIDTNPGYLKVANNVRPIKDIRNYGVLDITQVVAKSSNVGIAKLALSLPDTVLSDTFYKFGLGQPVNTGFPGEQIGKLPIYTSKKPVDLTSLSYGYGLEVTAMQLAQAYSILANGGIKHPVSITKLNSQPIGERVIPEVIAKQLVTMMEKVTHIGGTGNRASTDAYRVAGKTGTVHRISSVGGYSKDKYTAIFAGMAPVSDPRLVCVVVVNEPNGQEYYGGQVAAPVFSRIMSDSLRMLNVMPDKHKINLMHAKLTNSDQLPEAPAWAQVTTQ